MRVGEMRRIIQFRRVTLDPTARRLGACYSVADLRRAARRRIPRPVFDYVDGAADEEIAVEANVRAFRSFRFLPRVLAGVASVDPSTSLPGGTLRSPFVVGPAGYSRMLHPDGEIGAARSALRHGLPYTLSTMASTGIEELRAATGPDGDLWFQLYLTRDRSRAFNLVDRAAGNGYSTLVVTVDTIVAGNRLRDQRNGLSVPPALTPRTAVSVALKPSYWYRLLASPALDYANFGGGSPTTVMKTAEFFDPTLNWSDIEDLRSRWAGTLLLKGPVGPVDAHRAADLGVDGVQLSNHGGRQLDRVAAPVDLIAPVRDAAGPSFVLLVDSGVRHGADAAVALALGADAVALGRAYLYGLMAGGERGVDRALDLLNSEFISTMRFLGVSCVSELRKQGRELLARA